MDVTGFTGHVQRGFAAAYGCIQSQTSIATADDYRLLSVLAERFKDFFAEGLKVADDLGVSRILWGEAIIEALGEGR